MKTTIDLPDELMVAAKKKAAQDRTTLRALFERGLRSQLSTPRSAHRNSGRRRLRLVTVPGGLTPDLDLTDRDAMQDWIRRRR